MQLCRKHGANIIESELLVKIAGYFSSGKSGAQKAKAAAIFPFIFVRKEEYATPVFINHERIHFRQQLETLFIGCLVLGFIEDIYSGLLLRLNPENRYLYRAVEQEAYRNQENLNYLKNRQIFSLFNYLRDKRKLTFIENKAPLVQVGEKF